MFTRQQTGAVLCPSCGTLVGVNDAKCLNCGRANPGMWGFAPLLRHLGVNFSFTNLVVPACAVLFAVSLLWSSGRVRTSGLSFLGPSSQSLIALGASGAYPIFGAGHWWTVLSAGWLHAGLLHIVFNMMWVRDLGPVVAQLYGPTRLVVIYTVGNVAGFTLSSVAGEFLGDLPLAVLRGAQLTVGASAAIFGLLGSAIAYGHRTGSGLVSGQATQYALMMGLFGFIMPGVDNYAHLGGCLGGYVAGRLMNPNRPERLGDWVAAATCIVATVLALLASVALNSGLAVR